LSDLAVRGSLGLALEDSLQGQLFLLEVVVGTLFPAILLSFREFRRVPRGLLGASLLVMAGVVLNRVNVCWFGMSSGDTLAYIPTWMEIAVSLAFVTAGTIAFFLAVHYLPVFPEVKEDTPAKEIPEETPAASPA
jgi:Ni/Fe-hydrogenase subunit HybB-like protein